MQYAYVLNKRGEPLMPCSPGKARILLKQQKACVVKRTPFTIKLLHGSAGYKQPITLGVDAGSKHVGLSASTEKRELYSEEFTPRNDVVELLSTRRQNRRSRRNRKTRYRFSRPGGLITFFVLPPLAAVHAQTNSASALQTLFQTPRQIWPAP